MKPIFMPLIFLSLANIALTFVLSRIPIVNDLLKQNESSFIFVALLFNLGILFLIFKYYLKRR